MLEQAKRAYDEHHLEAWKAYLIYVVYCDGRPPRRVPGMDTVVRLVCRIAAGKTPEQAAAAEYLYRWELALDRSRAFGAPHALGM